MKSEDISALMGAFLAGGGEITKLNYAGQPVGVVTEDLPPAVPLPSPTVEPETAPSPAAPVVDLIAELRAIRSTARAWLRHLDGLPCAA